MAMDDIAGRAGRRAGRVIGVARRLATTRAPSASSPRSPAGTDAGPGIMFVENEAIDGELDYQLADEPLLVPPVSLMRTEGVDVIETWFRTAEEWSVVLRLFGGVGASSDVLEIGCGLGRIAFPLRNVLQNGTYSGFDISRDKIDFVTYAYRDPHPNFSFRYVDLRDPYANPEGTITHADFEFPYFDQSFDVVFGTSVWTHLLPQYAPRYFAEIQRVLRPGGTVLVSAFLLDNYEPGRSRPGPYTDARFDIVHEFGDHGADFAVSNPANPEMVAGYRLRLLEEYANHAGLVLDRPPLVGMWSGLNDSWVGAQDLVVFRRSPNP